MKNKHPLGLPFLFFTEMWERFGYYLMIGIFQLYLTTSAEKGGLGMDRKDAADIYGTFIAFVFLTPFLPPRSSLIPHHSPLHSNATP